MTAVVNTMTAAVNTIMADVSVTGGGHPKKSLKFKYYPTGARQLTLFSRDMKPF
jgi:hypothetical protein